MESSRPDFERVCRIKLSSRWKALIRTMTTILDRLRYLVVMNSGLRDHCNKVNIVPNMKTMGP